MRVFRGFIFINISKSAFFASFYCSSRNLCVILQAERPTLPLPLTPARANSYNNLRKLEPSLVRYRFASPSLQVRSKSHPYIEDIKPSPLSHPRSDEESAEKRKSPSQSLSGQALYRYKIKMVFDSYYLSSSGCCIFFFDS